MTNSLPEDLYWVKHDGVINILDNLEISLTNVDEIIEQVPSYEEWQAKLEENAQLKELLKECREVINWQTENYDEKPLVSKIDQVLQENE